VNPIYENPLQYVMKKHIPNLITLLNLLLGCAAILSVLQGHFNMAAYFIAGAAAADFADGLLARALNVMSPVGKELDSLADMISFGLFPGAALYTIMVLTEDPTLMSAMDGQIHWWAFPAFILSAASALRLAHFNLDDRQADGFLGLATPACTILILGLMLLFARDTFSCQTWLAQKEVIYPLVIVLSSLLLSEIPMFSFKFKHLHWEGNALRFIFVALSIILLVIGQELALAPIALLYIITNVVKYIFIKPSSL